MGGVQQPIGEMAAMMVTIDRMGRIVIPRAVRNRLGLTTGAELELVAQHDAIAYPGAGAQRTRCASTRRAAAPLLCPATRPSRPI
jgi:AbrB family looped-hinge helix DNA binding protein